jgi:hypothetical protein
VILLIIFVYHFYFYFIFICINIFICSSSRFYSLSFFVLFLSVFQITAEDDQENPIKKDSPSGAWKEVLERINSQKSAADKRAVCSVSGPGKHNKE